MTFREILNIGDQIGQKYINTICTEVVDAFVEKRKEEISNMIEVCEDKKDLILLKKKLRSLENAKKEKYYKVIKDRIRQQFSENMDNIADNTHLYLLNAEYFDFTGKLSR